MPHPLVDQLRFTRSEFRRGLAKVTAAESVHRFLPMNCMSWNVGHLAWQEQRYFLRYRVRRVMTSNGVRTAGISLQVRMDDPLTPADQEKIHVSEDEWYLPEFSGPEDKD